MLPVYYQIMQNIKSSIVNKEFVPGQKIPSENELAVKFKVSRMTVHQAIGELVHEGFIISRRGHGTFVTNNEDIINSASLEFRGCMDDLFFHQMLKTRIKSVVFETISPSKIIRERLGLDGKDCEVTEISRVQILRDGVFTHIANYLPAEIGSRIPIEQLYERTLLSILEKDLKIKFTEAVQTIEASFASQDIAEKLLNVPAYAIALPRLHNLPAQVALPVVQPIAEQNLLDFAAANVSVPATLESEIGRQKSHILSDLETRNLSFFAQETEKLDAWADDLKVGLEREIKELDRKIKETRTKSKGAATLAEKLAVQKEQRDLEGNRDRKRRELFQRQDEIQTRRDNLIDELEEQLSQQVTVQPLFACEWEVA